MLEVSSASETGPGHSVNEDTIQVHDTAGLFIVADGMGGQHAGEVASRLAVEIITRFVDRSLDTDEISWPFGIDTGLSLDSNRLVTAVRVANRRLWKLADEQVDYVGMGTTVVAAVVTEGTLTICWAGDSRAYLVRDGSVEQLTEDDSFLQAIRAQGHLKPEELRTHPMRNLVTMAVGAAENIDPHVAERRLEHGDCCLLCSDGLYKALPEAVLAEHIRAAASDPSDGAGTLVRAALASGSQDDVSTVLFRYMRP